MAEGISSKPCARHIWDNVRLDIGTSRFNAAPTRSSLQVCIHPVGVNECVVETVAKIVKTIGDVTSDASRKEPFLVCRCIRGGKTTILREVYNSMRHHGIKAIFVSFNRVYNFERNPGEAASEALFRMITNVLYPSLQPQADRVCDWEGLDRFIGEEPFLLVIDEVNALGRQIRKDLFLVIKKYFLDKRNRHIIMSSHNVMHLVDPAEHLFSSTCIRGVQLVRLPVSDDVDALKLMDPDACSGVNPRLVVYLGRIPSLVFSYCTKQESSVAQKISTLCGNKSKEKKESEEAFVAFCEALIRGHASPRAEEFTSFSSDVTDEGTKGIRHRWCPYIAEIILNKVFDNVEIAVEIAAQLHRLGNTCEKVGDGQSWEALVLVAILLRLVLTSAKGYTGPLDICDAGEAHGAEVKHVRLGCGTTTISQARLEIESRNADTKKPTLVVFTPVEATLEQVDGFVVFYNGTQVSAVSGYQCKDSSQGANGTAEDWISGGGHLFRSRASMRTRVVGQNDCNWTFYNIQQTDDFLGHSFMQMRLPPN